MTSLAPPSVVHPVVLVSIDGWGHSDKKQGNAILAASTPTMDLLHNSAYSALIDASGLSVGLPAGVMGNSEVGHLTMGSGRVAYQDLVRINASIEDGSFFTNRTTIAAFETAKKGTGRIHFLGLVSDGAVHSHIDHLEAFIISAKKAQVPKSYVHFFTDGRDTPPSSGTRYIKRLQDYLMKEQYGHIGTVIGRYYAMDRDKRWDRIAVAYNALFAGIGDKTNDIDLISFIESERYAKQENDEFLKPIIVNEDGLITNGDVLIFIDFRSDRMREITSLLAEPTNALPFISTAKIDRSSLHVNIMTQYDEKWQLPIIFPPQTMKNGLTEWLSIHGLRQFHTAETEKYAHVTFFFAGGREEPFPHEDRGLIPSPHVKTYDLEPAMSQMAVADSVAIAVASKQYPFIMCNFAAPDMVGHTGMYEAAVIACTVCDMAIGRVLAACEAHGYSLIVTADHGNAEEMEDDQGNPKTSHTTNLIPVLILPHPTSAASFTTAVSAILESKGKNACIGGLSDIAPTVLTLMGLDQPKEMTGKSLVKRTS